VRVVRCRFGIVLGERGGALDQMLPLFKKAWAALWAAAGSGFPGFTSRT